MEQTSSNQAVQIDLDTWERKALYDLFAEINEPFHGVCLRADCTKAFRHAKETKTSLFLTLIHRSLTAANQIEHFKTRIVGHEVWKYPVIHGGSAVGRPNGTIGFGYYSYLQDLSQFVTTGSREFERVKSRNDIERYVGQDLIRFSILPWFDFTSISHARDFAWRDSAPRITFGKVTEANGRCTMPISIHAHHALADGLHVAQFVERFEKCLEDLTVF